jgi:hypothetical protein
MSAHLELKEFEEVLRIELVSDWPSIAQKNASRCRGHDSLFYAFVLPYLLRMSFGKAENVWAERLAQTTLKLNVS